MALAGVSLLLAGMASWNDFLAIIARVNDPITTPHNFTPGAVMYQLGVSREVASLVQWAATVAGAGARWCSPLSGGPPLPSYLVVVVATQLLSPILWDHYAMLLLLPVAWLMDRGRTWARPIPLATCVVAGGDDPTAGLPGGVRGHALWRSRWTHDRGGPPCPSMVRASPS